MLPITRTDLLTATTLYATSTDLSARDAVHVATMRNDGIESMISADKDFDRVDGIRRLDSTEV
ncbi:MAG: hypothetical protein CME26_07840 [Gemmatimonadetes bacterium]|nr:hypothetical protein [Gemmatimonadota bacterium]